MFDRIQGYTLLELMTALAIVSILILMAVPLFSGYTEQGKIDELKANLLKAATAQEKYFANTGKYATSSAALASYDFPEVPNSKMKLFTGAVIINGIGMVYWVAGNYDVNSHVSGTYNECWIYFSSLVGTGDNFIRLHQETDNITADPSVCPLSNIAGVCNLDAICK